MDPFLQLRPRSDRRLVRPGRLFRQGRLGYRPSGAGAPTRWGEWPLAGRHGL